jgi:hypothetical protein
VTRDEAKVKGALALCGDYVLKTDKDLEATELWSLYGHVRLVRVRT